MFILAVKGFEEDGAFSLENDDGDKVLLMFEEEDDAMRYAMMLEEDGSPDMHVIEVETDIMVKTCEIHEYQYAIITKNDFVIPPKTDYDYI